MAKTPSKKLYTLIKTLTGHEKRYFKLFANANNNLDSKYIQLFDLIDKQNEFDDDYLVKILYEGKKNYGKKFSELKAYLYDLILKTLQGFDEKSSIDFRLKSMLKNVRVLFKRSLYDDCRDLLYKIKRLAKKHEVFLVLMEVCTWEKRVAYAKSDIEFIQKELSAIVAEETEAKTKLDNLNAYRNIFLELLALIRQDVMRREKVISEVDNLLEHPAMQQPENALSNRSKVMYYRIRAFYFYTKGNIENYYTTNKFLIELIEKLPFYKKENLGEYIAVLTNFMIASANLRRYHEIEPALEKLYKIKPLTYDDQINKYRQYYALKTKLCVTRGQFEEAVNVINNIRKDVGPAYLYLFEKDSFYFLFFYSYFGAEKFDESLDYLNKWLSRKKSTEREDLQSLARILNLVIHYEMKNDFLIESIVRSNMRYLKRQKGGYEFETILTEFFAKLNRLPADASLKREAFVELKKNLQQELTTPANKRLLSTFDMIAWIDSKVSGKNFRTIVQHNFEDLIRKG